MDVLRVLHSFARWAVVIVALAVIVYMLLGLVQKKSFVKLGNTLMSVFGGLVGLQWIIGLLFLLDWGGRVGFNQRHFWEHAFAMTLALVAAHAYIAWKRRDIPDQARYRNNLLAVLATFGFIFVGVLSLPDGLRWRAYLPSGVTETPATQEAPAEATPQATEAAS